MIPHTGISRYSQRYSGIQCFMGNFRRFFTGFIRSFSVCSLILMLSDQHDSVPLLLFYFLPKEKATPTVVRWV